MSPDIYPEKTRKVRIIQTHASIVAICDSYVYKVKKPINFEFLDFSTLEKRKFYCKEELRLNRRLSEGICLGIVAIHYDPNKRCFSFEAAGDVVDYAIKMHRMSGDGFLSYLIGNNLDQPSHYELIAKRLCEFYQKQPPQNLDPDYGTKESISYIVSENKAIRERFLNKTLHPLQESVIAAYQTDFLAKSTDLISKRVRDGWIRDVHGDLRLDHFHFAKKKLNIYDCIEFKERLRVNDVVNDLAFLSMELEYAGRHHHSLEVFGQVSNCIGDVANFELWRFYKIHRACVRGMVHAVTGYEKEIAPVDQELNKEKSKRLFSLATRYALLGNQPTVIVVFGGTATGKSTIASRLSELLGAPHIQSDVIRKELAGLAVDEYPDGATREWLYSTSMTQKTHEQMIQKGTEFLHKYNIVILDSRRSTTHQRELINTNFPNANVFWIRTTAAMEVRKKRLEEREVEKSISDARLDVLEQLLVAETDLTEMKKEPTLLLDTGMSIERCVNVLFEYLGSK